MAEIDTFLRTTIRLHLNWIIFIGLIYIIIHTFKDKKGLGILDIVLNYIPVLTHEFGHILFNKISGGRANDLVIVAKPSERRETGQQGFAVTQSRGRLNQIITTFGGYIMPPIMLYIGFLVINYQYPSIFVTAYLLIFLYFFLITSRKALPLLITVLLAVLLFFIFQNDNQVMMVYLVSITQHFILGVLLGEVLQSSWTIGTLTFAKQKIDWDGSALKALTFIPVSVFSLMWIGLNIYIIYQLFNIYF